MYNVFSLGAMMVQVVAWLNPCSPEPHLYVVDAFGGGVRIFLGCVHPSTCPLYTHPRPFTSFFSKSPGISKFGRLGLPCIWNKLKSQP